MNSKKYVKQSVLLTITKVLTMICGMIQAMMLAHKLSTGDYALYAKTSTCINIAASFSVMGLNDAVLFFFNKNADEEVRRRYIDSVFLLQIIIGIITGLILVMGMVPISSWMNNPFLCKTLPIVALQPLLTNLLSDYSTLYLSADLSKEIAIKSIIMAPIRLLLTIIAVFSKSPVQIYFVLIISFDLFQVLYFHFAFQKRKRITINPFKYEKSLLIEIVQFAVPLGVAIVAKSVLIECDKLVISNQCSEQEYATYAAVSRTLPITIFATSMASILLPKITKNYHEDNKNKMCEVLQLYYLCGAVTSVIIGFAILPISKEVICVLYSDKYISGNIIFILYIINDIIGFAYAGMLLTVTGNSKTLLWTNIGSLVVNLLLDYICLRVLGIIGPAIVTVTMSLFNFIFQSAWGCKKAGIKFVKVFPTKEVGISILKCSAVCVLLYFVKKMISLGEITNIILFGSLGIILSAAFCKGTLSKIYGLRQTK